MKVTRKAFGGLFGAGAFSVAGFTTARQSYPDKPPDPDFWEILSWLGSGSDPWAIAEQLARQEPGNSGWQRDLFFCHAKLAQLAEANDDIPLALEQFAKAEKVILALANQWPNHPGFVADLKTVQTILHGLAQHD